MTSPSAPAVTSTSIGLSSRALTFCVGVTLLGAVLEGCGSEDTKNPGAENSNSASMGETSNAANPTGVSTSAVNTGGTTTAPSTSPPPSNGTPSTATTTDGSSGGNTSGPNGSGTTPTGSEPATTPSTTAQSSDPNPAPMPSSEPSSETPAEIGESTGETPNEFFPCEGANPADYDVVATKTGNTWSVMKGAQEVYAGADFQQVLSQAYAGLSPGRTSKESILVVGDGEVPASAQLGIPSFTVLNVCGTVDVTGTPSGSDRSPFYARNAQQIDIPNLKLTGSPQYGIFFRQTSDVHLGQIELRLTRDAGIGIRVDAGPNSGSTTDFYQNLKIDHVYGTGMGSHIVETYGIDQVTIGSVEGEDVGECGLLLNRSIHAEIGSVTCTDCATGTGYAAFRVANSVGKVGNDFPAGNIHVGKVTARGGGRGIFSVSGCGGLVIDEIDIAGTGSTSILLQNTYNSVIAANSGTVSGGLVQLTNDTDNTNEGVYPPSKDVTLQNLTLTGGASVRQDWCNEFGSNGCSAVNLTGGNVSMCQ